MFCILSLQIQQNVKVGTCTSFEDIKSEITKEITSETPLCISSTMGLILYTKQTISVTTNFENKGEKETLNPFILTGSGYPQRENDFSYYELKTTDPTASVLISPFIFTSQLEWIDRFYKEKHETNFYCVHNFKGKISRTNNNGKKYYQYAVIFDPYKTTVKVNIEDEHKNFGTIELTNSLTTYAFHIDSFFNIGQFIINADFSIESNSNTEDPLIHGLHFKLSPYTAYSRDNMKDYNKNFPISDYSSLHDTPVYKDIKVGSCTDYLQGFLNPRTFMKGESICIQSREGLYFKGDSNNKIKFKITAKNSLGKEFGHTSLSNAILLSNIINSDEYTCYEIIPEESATISFLPFDLATFRIEQDGFFIDYRQSLIVGNKYDGTLALKMTSTGLIAESLVVIGYGGSISIPPSKKYGVEYTYAKTNEITNVDFTIVSLLIIDSSINEDVPIKITPKNAENVVPGTKIELTPFQIISLDDFNNIEAPDSSSDSSDDFNDASSDSSDDSSDDSSSDSSDDSSSDSSDDSNKNKDNESNPEQESSKSNELSNGSIAGISIGCIIAVAIIIFCVFWFVIRKKADEESSSKDNEKVEP